MGIFKDTIMNWCKCLDLSLEVMARPWKRPEELPYRQMVGAVFGQPRHLVKSYSLFMDWIKGKKFPSDWGETFRELNEFTYHFWTRDDINRQFTPVWPEDATQYLEEVFSVFFSTLTDKETEKAFRLLCGEDDIPMESLAEKLGIADGPGLLFRLQDFKRKVQNPRYSNMLYSFAFRDRPISVQSIISRWKTDRSQQERKAKFQSRLAEWKGQIPSPILNRTIEELHLLVRSYNCLKNAHIATVDDILRKSEGELLRIDLLWFRSLKDINGALQAIDTALYAGCLCKGPEETIPQ